MKLLLVLSLLSPFAVAGNLYSGNSSYTLVSEYMTTEYYYYLSHGASMGSSSHSVVVEGFKTEVACNDAGKSLDYLRKMNSPDFETKYSRDRKESKSYFLCIAM